MFGSLNFGNLSFASLKLSVDGKGENSGEKVSNR